MSEDKATTSNDKQIVVINSDKHWVTWILDIFVAIGAISQIVIGIILILQLRAYEASNELTRQTLDLTKQNLSITAQGVGLTQQSIALSEKSLDLTQKSLEATQQQLTYAQRANDISQQSLKASLSSWIEIKFSGYKKNDLGIEIDYSVKNISTQPAHKVMPMCVIEGYEKQIFDETVFADSDAYPFVILPNQTVPYKSQLIGLMAPSKVEQVVKEIDNGKIQISIIVDYQDVLGNRSNFVETLRKDGWNYTADEEFDASPEKILKILGANMPSK